MFDMFFEIINIIDLYRYATFYTFFMKTITLAILCLIEISNVIKFV